MGNWRVDIRILRVLSRPCRVMPFTEPWSVVVQGRPWPGHGMVWHGLPGPQDKRDGKLSSFIYSATEIGNPQPTPNFRGGLFNVSCNCTLEFHLEEEEEQEEASKRMHAIVVAPAYLIPS